LLILASKFHLSLVVQFYFTENKPGYLKVMVPEGFGQYQLLNDKCFIFKGYQS